MMVVEEFLLLPSRDMFLVGNLRWPFRNLGTIFLVINWKSFCPLNELSCSQDVDLLQLHETLYFHFTSPQYSHR